MRREESYDVLRFLRVMMSMSEMSCSGLLRFVLHRLYKSLPVHVLSQVKVWDLICWTAAASLRMGKRRAINVAVALAHGGEDVHGPDGLVVG